MTQSLYEILAKRYCYCAPPVCADTPDSRPLQLMLLAFACSICCALYLLYVGLWRLLDRRSLLIVESQEMNLSDVVQSFALDRAKEACKFDMEVAKIKSVNERFELLNTMFEAQLTDKFEQFEAQLTDKFRQFSETQLMFRTRPSE